MLNIITFALWGSLILLVSKKYRDLKKNIAKATKTGLPYIVVPYWGYGSFWMMVIDILTPLFRLLPFSDRWQWLKLVERGLSWRTLRYAEDKYGDTFLLVSPWICYLKTSDAPLIAQITSRRNDFLKPVATYKIVDIFGGSILTSEGQEWKRHKKVVGPSFSEKSNKLVFEESLRQAEGLMHVWKEAGSEGDGLGNGQDGFRVLDPLNECAELSLHVISAAGFGVPQLWPHQSEDVLEGDPMGGFGGKRLMGGHTLSLKDGLQSLLMNLLFFAFFKPWVLEYLPIKRAKDAHVAFRECLNYFSELIAIKKQQIALGSSNEHSTMDLLRPMIQASPLLSESEKSQAASKSGDAQLTKPEIIGNSFIFLFAGHETSANSIHFALIYLALSPSIQAEMQSQIDSIVGTLPPSKWEYNVHMPKLYNSLVGATLNEEMRLIPAIPNIPKYTNGNQVIKVDGRDVELDDDIFIHLNVVGVNRNPKFWKTAKSELTGEEHDMDDFSPKRWLPDITTDNQPTQNGIKENGHSKHTKEEEALSSPSFLTTTPTSLRPPEKGAFLSFSEGPRVCPGRRFAQVEITAVLAFIFQKYSVELDVREWASDEEVAKMSKEERQKVYGEASKVAREKIRRGEQFITLQLLREDKVGLRFVERGGERFRF